MALSKQVEESLRDAESNLRNALAFSARNEKPYISKHIADMIANIDTMIAVDNLLTKFDDTFKGKGMGETDNFFT